MSTTKGMPSTYAYAYYVMILIFFKFYIKFEIRNASSTHPNVYGYINLLENLNHYYLIKFSYCLPSCNIFFFILFNIMVFIYQTNNCLYWYLHTGWRFLLTFLWKHVQPNKFKRQYTLIWFKWDTKNIYNNSFFFSLFYCKNFVNLYVVGDGCPVEIYIPFTDFFYWGSLDYCRFLCFFVALVFYCKILFQINFLKNDQKNKANK